MTRRLKSNDRFRRFQLRLFQVGDKRVLGGVFIRYDAYRLYAYIAAVSVPLAFVPYLGPLFVFGAVGAAGYAWAAEPRSLVVHPWRAIGAGLALWLAFYMPTSFGWWNALLCGLIVPWPITVVTLQHLGDRTLHGLLALWLHEVRSWWADRWTRANTPRHYLARARTSVHPGPPVESR